MFVTVTVYKQCDINVADRQTDRKTGRSDRLDRSDTLGLVRLR